MFWLYCSLSQRTFDPLLPYTRNFMFFHQKKKNQKPNKTINFLQTKKTSNPNPTKM